MYAELTPKLEIAFDFIREIPLRQLRLNKNHQQIEIATNFTNEIPLKLFWTNKQKQSSD